MFLADFLKVLGWAFPVLSFRECALGHWATRPLTSRGRRRRHRPDDWRTIKVRTKVSTSLRAASVVQHQTQPGGVAVGGGVKLISTPLLFPYIAALRTLCPSRNRRAQSTRSNGIKTLRKRTQTKHHPGRRARIGRRIRASRLAGLAESRSDLTG